MFNLKSHLIHCLLCIKFAFPIPFEVDGIDKDKSGESVQHVRLDQIFDLVLGDLLYPVVDQLCWSLSVAVVSFLSCSWSVIFCGWKFYNFFNLLFKDRLIYGRKPEWLHGSVGARFLCKRPWLQNHSGGVWIQSQKINLQMILYLGEYGVGCLQCEILICSQCRDGIFIPKGKFLWAER